MGLSHIIWENKWWGQSGNAWWGKNSRYHKLYWKP